MYIGDISLKDAKEKIKTNEAHIDNLFYDWFCSDSSLSRKAETLLKRAQYIINQLNLDESKIKISFKNCCPCNGDLYDRIYIENILDDSFISITPRFGHYGDDYKKCELYFDQSNKDIYFNDWKTFKKELKNVELQNNIREELNVK